MSVKTSEMSGERDARRRVSLNEDYSLRVAGANGARGSFGRETDQGAHVGRNYTELADMISKAASTIGELVKRNQALRREADMTISGLRADCVAEKERADKLQAELDNALAERAQIIDETERRVRELSAAKNDIADRLEKTSAELDLANQWLEYLNSHVQSHLGEAIRRADGIFRNRQNAA